MYMCRTTSSWHMYMANMLPNDRHSYSKVHMILVNLSTANCHNFLSHNNQFHAMHDNDITDSKTNF